MAENLWGDLPGAEDVKTPLAFLREQAEQLSSLSTGVLEGTVKSSTDFLGRFLHELSIVVPALGGYRYSVVTVRHDLELYPLTVIREGDEIRAEDADDYVDILRTVLSSDAVRRVIAALLAQSNETELV